MRLKIIQISFTLLSYLSFSQQNLKENFIPLKSSGELPDIFTQNIRNIIKDDIAELNRQKEKDKSIKQNYLTVTNYEIEKIVKSGNTLINDEITVYLNKIADVILKNNPALRNELHIFTLKTPVVNAYSYDKGYIFIDIGLIAQAETEAQLAFILSHEIAHYVKRHQINGYVKYNKINRQNYNGSNEDKLIEKCQYSKEFESEADIEGFKLFEQTNYSFKQAEKAFDMLQYAHLPFELVEFKKSFFETDNYKLPNNYFLKNTSSIKNNSNEDDTKSTHPNTTKRKQTIADLSSNRNNLNRTNTIIGQDVFEYNRDLARMELARLYLKRRDYPNALYAAYILIDKYPNNLYLSEVISKCLYSVTLYGNGKLRYAQDSYLNGGIPSYSDIESYPQQVYYLIEKMPVNEWTMLSLNYVYREHKKHPSSKIIAQCSDSLFRIMGRTNWGINDFVRANKKAEVISQAKLDSLKINEETKSKTDLIADIQKETNIKIADTVYYKDMYVDLFVNDAEFISKFPTSSVESNAAFSSYKKKDKKKNMKKSKNSEYIKSENNIERVLLLEPFYIKIDEKQEEQVQYISSDKKQETYIETVNDCAQMLNFELVTLDPGLITSQEVNKMNDYSIINDWFSEKFDAHDNDDNLILNTDEIDDIIAKYNTKYVFKTGIINYRSKKGKKRTCYYGFVYDIKANQVVYKKYQAFRDRDSKDLINAKLYQTFYELKHSK